MAKKKKHPEHVNHERWLVSYADFITLLFAFFTVLYAVSSVDSNKAQKLALSVSQAFDVNVFSMRKSSRGGDAIESQLRQSFSMNARPIRVMGLPTTKGVGGNAKKLSAIASTLKNRLQGRGLGGKVNVSSELRGVVISLEANGFFPSGSNKVGSEGLPLLDSISSVLAEAQLPLRIEGHTDSQGKGTSRSNWELSASRAVTIVSHLIEKYGYPDKLLSAAGYGDTRPVADNDTEAGRSKNRRIDIVVLREFPKPNRIAWVKQEDEEESNYKRNQAQSAH